MKDVKQKLTLKQLKLWVTMCVAILMLTLIVLNWSAPKAAAQVAGDAPPPLAALNTVPVPEPPELYTYVANKAAAIALGKALFWDMQVGSDGIQSCASCHFHAGADNRSKNQINPGCGDCVPGGDGFQFGGPNYQSQVSDYPFHKLADPANRFSSVLYDRNEVTSSQGVFLKYFQDIVIGSAQDRTVIEPHRVDGTFNIGGVITRRVEPRNTPTTINAVFNHRNFWDGRASNEFNGVSPFGSSDPNAKLLKNVLGNLTTTTVRLTNASLASQAVGPVLSDFEMSGYGRDFLKVGKKMLSLRPLAKQKVAADDSVLAVHRDLSGVGLKTSYASLIQQAFRSEWWNSTMKVNGGANRTPVLSPTGYYSQMEWNFSLFFGIAVQLYEATLVSDQSPMDKYLRGDMNALTAKQIQGKQIFEGKGKCIECHSGAELTGATVSQIKNAPTELMAMGDGGQATYDDGFYNIGVRPTREDKGVGNHDPFGRPLSFSRRSTTGRVAVDGAFKTPGLRNVELTAPFFHNGGQFSLEQVVEFYNRGGDFHELNIANLDPDIVTLGLTADERSALVDFMKAMTDERVRYHAAPFDHPELIIPNGHPGNTTSVTNSAGQATDAFITLPAIGKNGTGTKSLKTFSETRYREVTTWGITSYWLGIIPIWGWITKTEPYTYTYTREVWSGIPPTRNFLQ